MFKADLKETKSKVKAEFVRRQQKVWSSNLNAKGKVRVASTWATAVLKYFLSAIRWTKTDVMHLDRRTRRIMRQNKCHHYGAAKERVHMPRNEGGRGVQSVAEVWEREVLSSAVYLERNTDAQVKGAVLFQKRMAKLGIEQQILPTRPSESNFLGRRKRLAMIKTVQLERLREKMAVKKLHGVFYRQMLLLSTDRKATNRWLNEGRLRAETEGITIAA